MSESKIMGSNFVFQQSYYDTALMFPGKDFEKFLLILIKYGLFGEEPDFSPMSKSSQFAAATCFVQIRHRIDSSKRRYQAAVENGKRGGRPKNAENDAEKTRHKTSRKTSKSELVLETKPSENQSQNQSENQTQNHNINSNNNTLGNYYYHKGTVTPSSEPHGSAPSPVPEFEPYTMEQAIADIEAKAAAKRERERIAEEAKKEEWRKLDERREKERAERLAKAAELRRMAEEQMTTKEAEVSAG